MGNSTSQTASSAPIIVCKHCACDVDLRPRNQQCPRCHGPLEISLSSSPTSEDAHSAASSLSQRPRASRAGSMLMQRVRSFRDSSASSLNNNNNNNYNSKNAVRTNANNNNNNNSSSSNNNNKNNKNSASNSHVHANLIESNGNAASSSGLNGNNSNNSSNFSNNRGGGGGAPARGQRFLEHVHVVPFKNSLNELEEKEINDELLINSLLKPFFAQHGTKHTVQAGNRFFIKNVEFKVFACYPPQGIVVNTTQFHLNDNDGHLMTLHDRPIWRIHVLPTKTSLRSYYRIHPNLAKPSYLDDADEKEDDIDPSMRNKHDHKDLLNSHLREYLKSPDETKYILQNYFSHFESKPNHNNNNRHSNIDRNANNNNSNQNNSNNSSNNSNSSSESLQSSANSNNSNQNGTESKSDENESKSNNNNNNNNNFNMSAAATAARRKHPKPNATIGSSSSSSSSSGNSSNRRRSGSGPAIEPSGMNSNNISNINSNNSSVSGVLSERDGRDARGDGRGAGRGGKRHLMEGELFVFNGVEFRVMACQPKDGFVTPNTAVHVAGEPVVDIKSMTIRPLSETLPNRHKELNEAEIKKIYLDPYFKGRSRYVDRTREVKIYGVDFAIIKSVPRAGIITCNTKVTQKPPMDADDLRERQEEEDMALARRLQEEEDRRNGGFGPLFMLAPRGRRIGSGPGAAAAAAAAAANGGAAADANGNDAQRSEAQRQQQSLEQFQQLFEVLRMAHAQRAQGGAAAAQGADGAAAAAAGGGGAAQGNDGNGDGGDPLGMLLRQLRMASEARRGLPPTLMDRLPSYTYRDTSSPSKQDKPAALGAPGSPGSPGSAVAADDADDASGTNDTEEMSNADATRTCRICLEHYSEGDVIKILPCLHKYHEECVDSWFKMSRKCPICNMDVTQAF